MIKRSCYCYYVRCILVAFDANFQLCFLFSCEDKFTFAEMAIDDDGVIKINDAFNDVTLTPPFIWTSFDLVTHDFFPSSVVDIQRSPSVVNDDMDR